MDVRRGMYPNQLARRQSQQARAKRGIGRLAVAVVDLGVGVDHAVQDQEFIRGCPQVVDMGILTVLQRRRERCRIHRPAQARVADEHDPDIDGKADHGDNSDGCQGHHHHQRGCPRLTC